MKKMCCIVLFCLCAVSMQAQIKAVVGAISANGSLYTSGFNDVSIKLISVTSDQFSIVEKLDRIKNYVYNELSKDLPFPLVPESVLLGNEAYQDYVKESNKFLDNLNNFAQGAKIVAITNDPLSGSGAGARIGSPGYLLDRSLNGKDITAITDFFTEEQPNTALSIDIDCCLAPVFLTMGSGSAVALVKVYMRLTDKNGKLLMHVWTQGKSVQNFGIVGGQIVKNRDNIPIALNEAMDDLFVKMPESLPKAIKKLEKKLVKYKYK